MLYYLFDFLDKTFDLPGSGLFHYISFRAVLAALLALVVSIWFGKYFIALLKRRNISEVQRDEKLDPFNTQKKGVPTMGGIVIIVSVLLPCLLIGKLSNVYLVLMIITTLLLGTLGFVDDYIKTFKKNKEGLNGWWKIAGQVTLGLIVGLTLRFSPVTVMNETVDVLTENNVTVVYKSPDVKSTQTTIPFLKNHNFNYADMFNFLGTPYKYWAGWVFFVLLTVIVVAAVSNSANLNDGMDGMTAGNSAIIGVALIVLAYVSGSTLWADYFDVMYIPQSEELVVFLSAFVGALIGFLWYNSFPAQIFMGDTGSLTIGGIIAVSAVIIHKELLLPILCGVFLIESLSVILQRNYYVFNKKRGQHKRLWKRTPIHDHFRTSMEQVLKVDPTCVVKFKGSKELHHETKITLRFWIVTIILAALTILTLKIR
ncbi:MAG: phospho-N-acetylmuramoyl-pentapeptide-transferase [Paludibacteraceae bacterium]|nr:phospho-N-acetylmuramoyl-pentapeptide-transferase [Paludibacteraceae bacterium]